MAASAGAAGAANDAKVEIGPPATTEATQRQREQLADEAEQAVKAIEAKLAGWKQTLADKKAEAKQLRAEADKGASG
jgi:hypothetical protein